eukprot:ANDGO_06272.mRNA.1 hypothetical protein
MSDNYRVVSVGHLNDALSIQEGVEQQDLDLNRLVQLQTAETLFCSVVKPSILVEDEMQNHVDGSNCSQAEIEDHHCPSESSRKNEELYHDDFDSLLSESEIPAREHARPEPSALKRPSTAADAAPSSKSSSKPAAIIQQKGSAVRPASAKPSLGRPSSTSQTSHAALPAAANGHSNPDGLHAKLTARLASLNNNSKELTLLKVPKISEAKEHSSYKDKAYVCVDGKKHLFQFKPKNKMSAEEVALKELKEKKAKEASARHAAASQYILEQKKKLFKESVEKKRALSAQKTEREAKLRVLEDERKQALQKALESAPKKTLDVAKELSTARQPVSHEDMQERDLMKVILESCEAILTAKVPRRPVPQARSARPVDVPSGSQPPLSSFSSSQPLLSASRPPVIPVRDVVPSQLSVSTAAAVPPPMDLPNASRSSKIREAASSLQERIRSISQSLSQSDQNENAEPTATVEDEEEVVEEEEEEEEVYVHDEASQMEMSAADAGVQLSPMALSESAAGWDADTDAGDGESSVIHMDKDDHANGGSDCSSVHRAETFAAVPVVKHALPSAVGTQAIVAETNYTRSARNHAAAIQIQTIFRGWIVRRSFQAKLSAFRREVATRAKKNAKKSLFEKKQSPSSPSPPSDVLLGSADSRGQKSFVRGPNRASLNDVLRDAVKSYAVTGPTVLDVLYSRIMSSRTALSNAPHSGKVLSSSAPSSPVSNVLRSPRSKGQSISPPRPKRRQTRPPQRKSWQAPSSPAVVADASISSASSVSIPRRKPRRRSLVESGSEDPFEDELARTVNDSTSTASSGLMSPKSLFSRFKLHQEYLFSMHDLELRIAELERMKQQSEAQRENMSLAQMLYVRSVDDAKNASRAAAVPVSASADAAVASAVSPAPLKETPLSSGASRVLQTGDLGIQTNFEQELEFLKSAMRAETTDLQHDESPRLTNAPSYAPLRAAARNEEVRLAPAEKHLDFGVQTNFEDEYEILKAAIEHRIPRPPAMPIAAAEPTPALTSAAGSGTLKKAAAGVSAVSQVPAKTEAPQMGGDYDEESFESLSTARSNVQGSSPESSVIDDAIEGSLSSFGGVSSPSEQSTSREYEKRRSDELLYASATQRQNGTFSEAKSTETSSVVDTASVAYSESFESVESFGDHDDHASWHSGRRSAVSVSESLEALDSVVEEHILESKLAEDHVPDEPSVAAQPSETFAKAHEGVSPLSSKYPVAAAPVAVDRVAEDVEDVSSFVGTSTSSPEIADETEAISLPAAEVELAERNADQSNSVSAPYSLGSDVSLYSSVGKQSVDSTGAYSESFESFSSEKGVHNSQSLSVVSDSMDEAPVLEELDHAIENSPIDRQHFDTVPETQMSEDLPFRLNAEKQQQQQQQEEEEDVTVDDDVEAIGFSDEETDAPNLLMTAESPKSQKASLVAVPVVDSERVIGDKQEAQRNETSSQDLTLEAVSGAVGGVPAANIDTVVEVPIDEDIVDAVEDEQFSDDFETFSDVGHPAPKDAAVRSPENAVQRDQIPSLTESVGSEAYSESFETLSTHDSADLSGVNKSVASPLLLPAGRSEELETHSVASVKLPVVIESSVEEDIVEMIDEEENGYTPLSESLDDASLNESPTSESAFATVQHSKMDSIGVSESQAMPEAPFALASALSSFEEKTKAKNSSEAVDQVLDSVIDGLINQVLLEISAQPAPDETLPSKMIDLGQSAEFLQSFRKDVPPISTSYESLSGSSDSGVAAATPLGSDAKKGLSSASFVDEIAVSQEAALESPSDIDKVTVPVASMIDMMSSVEVKLNEVEEEEEEEEEFSEEGGIDREEIVESIELVADELLEEILAQLIAEEDASHSGEDSDDNLSVSSVVEHDVDDVDSAVPQEVLSALSENKRIVVTSQTIENLTDEILSELLVLALNEKPDRPHLPPTSSVSAARRGQHRRTDHITSTDLDELDEDLYDFSNVGRRPRPSSTTTASTTSPASASTSTASKIAVNAETAPQKLTDASVVPTDAMVRGYVKSVMDEYLKQVSDPMASDWIIPLPIFLRMATTTNVPEPLQIFQKGLFDACQQAVLCFASFFQGRMPEGVPIPLALRGLSARLRFSSRSHWKENCRDYVEKLVLSWKNSLRISEITDVERSVFDELRNRNEEWSKFSSDEEQIVGSLVDEIFDFLLLDTACEMERMQQLVIAM